VYAFFRRSARPPALARTLAPPRAKVRSPALKSAWWSGQSGMPRSLLLLFPPTYLACTTRARPDAPPSNTVAPVGKRASLAPLSSQPSFGRVGRGDSRQSWCRSWFRLSHRVLTRSRPSPNGLSTRLGPVASLASLATPVSRIRDEGLRSRGSTRAGSSKTLTTLTGMDQTHAWFRWIRDVERV